MSLIPDNNAYLTFEYDEHADRLEIHGNQEGLAFLVERIQSLIAGNKPEHVHLMTPEWGWGGLCSEPQNTGAMLINHVKIHRW